MVIHSLNLNEDGGVIPRNDVSLPENAASVIIGIGGTGVSTLKIIKKKVFTQLDPSNPGEPVPRYDMIRFLAIDTDDTAVDSPKSVSDLQKNSGEFINIKPHNLGALLDPNSPTGRTALKKRPDLSNWMSIDKIQPLLAEDGAGGIRQMGRFMLMENAQRVYDAITGAIHSAMSGISTGGQVNIHIIAGISGGTGSGCFIDTCYLVRKVLESHGWAGKLFGYFFLPDVVIAKPQVRSNVIKEQLNRRNGYAAFRELDYLMDLESAHDCFRQRYPGSIPSVDTQMPPVDLAHLISATDINGNIPASGFEYSLNVVSDYIMAYLAHVELDGANAGQDGGLTMQGHLANIVAGVSGINRSSGANHSYTILGASNAEVPFSQIATYLAQDLYKKISSISGAVPGDNEVDRFAEDLRLNTKEIYRALTRNAAGPSSLRQSLEIINPADCRGMPVAAGQIHPDILVRPAAAWRSSYEGKVEDACRGLAAKLLDYGMPEAGQNNSYISLIHGKLLSICRNSDGRGGPKYAAHLLSRSGRGLITLVHGLIEENNANLNHEQNQDKIISDSLIRARDEFMRTKFDLGKKKWHTYLDALVRFMDHEVKITTMKKANFLLMELKRQLQELHTEFYRKLDTLCDNLSETFTQNAVFLNNPERLASSSPYTWRVIELKDVRDDLDAILREIAPEAASEKLMDWLLRTENQDEWRSESDYRIGRVVNAFMLDFFSEELSATIETYIKAKYPGLSDSQIQKQIEKDFLMEADKKAEPMFWKVPGYRTDSGTTFDSNIMTIPASSAMITQAAIAFQEDITKVKGRSYAVRRSGISDRIFSLRFNSGIPLFAYQGVTLMKADYESDLRNGIVGLHLYESNTAVEAKAEKTSEDLRLLEETAWGSFLPSPIPFSRAHTEHEAPTEEEQHLVSLFEKAKKLGVIAKDPVSNFWIFFDNRLKDEAAADDRSEFLENGAFHYGKAEETLARCKTLLSGWTEATNCSTSTILSNIHIEPGYEDAVVLDTFMRFPKLIRGVEDNLRRRDLLEKRIAAIEALIAGETGKTEVMQFFIDCLVTGVIRQRIGKVVYTEIEYGLEEEKRLDTQPAGLGAQFQLYKAYVGFHEMDSQKRQELYEQAAQKLNDLNEGDDELANMLRRKHKASYRGIVEQAKLMPTAQCEDILNFYEDYQKRLESFCRDYFFESYTPFAKL